MRSLINPFNELYLTENVSPGSFVRMFSPVLLSDAIPLFTAGNVVLTGTQGCGKSMLLALLRPEIRLAYLESHEPFPLDEVDHSLGRFVGCGINLTLSGSYVFGQRPIEEDDLNVADRSIPVYFGDFVNHWILADLLRGLDLYAEANDRALLERLGLRIERSKLDEFATELSRSDCWFGAMDGVRGYMELQHAVATRLTQYRAFLNYNLDSLPEKIRRTKTTAGEPVSNAVAALRHAGVLATDTNCIIQIDQYEELVRLEAATREQGVHRRFRNVIESMLSRRDRNVSYRIGTRRHAWPEEFHAQGSSVVVEQLRNYDLVDLDELLRDREHSTGLFGRFSDDVFRRRLLAAGYGTNSDTRGLLRHVFSSPLPPEDKARRYAGDGAGTVLKCDPEWPAPLRTVLSDIEKDSPLSAKLGEAWLRQQLRRHSVPSPSELSARPWDDKGRQWWKKERISQALLQIAARKQQRMLWSGAKEITNLSYGHILIFLSICNHVWASWLRRETVSWQGSPHEAPSIPDVYVQDAGIQLASKYWYQKIRTDPGGDSRRRLISLMAGFFRERLRSDETMSYPGGNGFTLPTAELESSPDISRVLNEAVAYGFLINRRHTPRSKNRGESIKWHLHPILCPYFDIPYQRTKEPIELRIGAVRDWCVAAGVPGVSVKQVGRVDNPPEFDDPQLKLAFEREPNEPKSP